MDSVAPRVGADQHQAVARALGPRSHEAIDANQAYAHRVDEWIVGVALVEIDLATDGRDADAVAVPADAGNHSFDVMAGFRQRPEAQRVEQRNRSRAHRDDVADDAANACRGPLVG